MEMRIFTLPFDELSESFPDEIIAEFCLNKKVHHIQAQFFLQEGRPFWSVAVQYEIVLKGEEKLRDLDQGQKRVLRGGSWNNNAGNACVSNRNNNYGFRLANTETARATGLYGRLYSGITCPVALPARSSERRISRQTARLVILSAG